MIQQHRGKFEVTIPYKPADDEYELYTNISQWRQECKIDFPNVELGMVQEYADRIILVVPTMELAIMAAMRFT